jgi:hypothetical protein
MGGRNAAWQPRRARGQSNAALFSRCTDRSAGGCADKPTVATARARACDDLDCDFSLDMYQMTLCEAGEAADCVTWVGMPACLLGFRELFVQNFRSVALAPKIIPAFLSSPDGCFMIKRS